MEGVDEGERRWRKVKRKKIIESSKIN